MKQNLPGNLDANTRKTFSDMLQLPSMWTDDLIHETLGRRGGQPFDVEDVRHLIKDYLSVLSDKIRRGDAL